MHLQRNPHKTVYVTWVVYPPHNADHNGPALLFQRAKLLPVDKYYGQSGRDHTI